MIHILSGRGGIQVDFKNYHDWNDKLVFLEKGQYIKFLSADFVVRKIEFEDEAMFRSKDVRVLFKHLVSLGYINFTECDDCQKFLQDAIFNKTTDLIDISSQQWYWQNPFKANKEEYHVIFDVKDIIDKEYKNNLNSEELSKLIGRYDINPHSLYSNKVGVTIKGLLGNKRLVESKKEIAFTDKSIKEVSYEYGFKDPAYFNRTFKSNTGKTPNEFRESIEFEREDTFISNIYELLKEFHGNQRNVGFYADRMNMSVKSLTNKVREKLQISIGQLIRQEIVHSAKSFLKQGMPVNEVAFRLGFEESNHFSSFFKHHTGLTPTDFQNQKVQ